MPAPETTRPSRSRRASRGGAVALLLAATLAVGAGGAPASAIGPRPLRPLEADITIQTYVKAWSGAVQSVKLSHEDGRYTQCVNLEDAANSSEWLYATVRVVKAYQYTLASYTGRDCKFQDYRAGTYGPIDVNHPKWSVYSFRAPKPAS